ncbi:hypothetical protein DPMN_174810, partial [Dreissena polymorpha]
MMNEGGIASFSDLESIGQCMDEYWVLKKTMAPGCEPEFVARLMTSMRPYALGMCMAGAGVGDSSCRSGSRGDTDGDESARDWSATDDAVDSLLPDDESNDVVTSRIPRGTISYALRVF